MDDPDLPPASEVPLGPQRSGASLGGWTRVMQFLELMLRRASEADGADSSQFAAPTPPLSTALSYGELSQNWRQLMPAGTVSHAQLMADSGDLGEFRLVAASVAGKLHLTSGIPRQDAYDFAPCGGGVVVAVADGPRTPLANGVAAELAVHTAVMTCVELWDQRCGLEERETIIAKALEVASETIRSKNALELRASGHGDEVEPTPETAWATTCTLALVHITDEGKTALSFACVGDSPIIIGEPGDWEVLAGDPRGFGTELSASLPTTLGDIQHVDFEAGTTLLLATDGFAKDFLGVPEMAEWFATNLVTARSPVAAAYLAGYDVQGSFDDRTFLALTRLPHRD